jgi:hypothetical protein
MRVTGICKGKIRFKADSGEEIGSFDIELRAATPELPLTHSASPFLWYIPRAWTVFFFGIGAQPAIAIPKQGRYVAVFEGSDNETIIGEFYCALVEPLPPTPERLAAMKSDPGAAKAVRAVFGCSFCTSKCQVYTAFERMPELEAEGFIWYQEIPEHFTCECGKAQFDLSTVRRNFSPYLTSDS